MTKAKSADGPATRASDVDDSPHEATREELSQRASDWMAPNDGGTVDEGSASYPGLAWVNGDPKLRKLGGMGYYGGWFLAGDTGISPQNGSVWTSTSRVTSSGEEISGWWCHEIVVTPIRYRRCWTVRVDGHTYRAPWDSYDALCDIGKAWGQTPRSAADMLCSVDGLPGYVALSHRGTMTRQLTDRQGWYQLARQRVSLPASRMLTDLQTARWRKAGGRGSAPARASLPLLRFQLTLGTARDSKGAPLFTEVGRRETSTVTRPLLMVPGAPCVSLGDVSAVALSRTVWSPHENEWHEAQSWVDAWSPEALLPRLPASSQPVTLSSSAAPTYDGTGNGATLGEPDTSGDVPF